MTADTDWEERKQLILETWPGLAMQDLNTTEGKRDALAALIAAQTGTEQTTIEEELEALFGPGDL